MLLKYCPSRTIKVITDFVIHCKPKENVIAHRQLGSENERWHWDASHLRSKERARLDPLRDEDGQRACSRSGLGTVDVHFPGKEPATLGVRCYVTRKGKRTGGRMGDAVDVEPESQLGRRRAEEGRLQAVCVQLNLNDDTWEMKIM